MKDSSYQMCYNGRSGCNSLVKAYLRFVVFGLLSVYLCIPVSYVIIICLLQIAVLLLSYLIGNSGIIKRTTSRATTVEYSLTVFHYQLTM